MTIEKVNIFNYKCFNGKFTICLSDGINIIVGNNESGKSTILEAIHLALTGVINGRYLRNELSQYLFNKDIISCYLKSLNTESKQEPPSVIIEIFFPPDTYPKLIGTNNSERIERSGIVFKIEFDEDYNEEYAELLKEENKLEALPIEYYKISWHSFAYEPVTAKSIPVKSAFIDSSSSRLQNSSDVYISRIIQNDLDDKEKVKISQAYRKMQESFVMDQSVISINQKIKEKTKISNRSMEISVELPTQNAWESSLMTFVDEVPFHQIGKGEQCVIKTNLALEHKKNKESEIILLEEPENHLTYSKLSLFIDNVQKNYLNKQIIVTTHSSFVANKLDLHKLILLNGNKTIPLSDLNNDTYRFFQKIAGYPTLRLMLCKKAVLVEGDSDELIFQKAYIKKYSKIPIQTEIDVISVGLSFKRFLEIAEELEKNVAVITDNDGNYSENIEKKYKNYWGKSFISIFADSDNTLNTLEPQFVRANKENLKKLCAVIGINFEKYNSESSISTYMSKHKTDWALAIFESEQDFNFPEYIEKAVLWCHE
jgi:putative ATP-dependent endonuclease of OLD family